MTTEWGFGLKIWVRKRQGSEFVPQGDLSREPKGLNQVLVSEQEEKDLETGRCVPGSRDRTSRSSYLSLP